MFWAGDRNCLWTTMSVREFQFVRPATVDLLTDRASGLKISAPSQSTWAASPPVGCRPNIHCCHLLLLSPKSDTHFTIPWRVKGWVNLDTQIVAGPRAWNSLPPAVRFSATYNIFKKDLKSHLFGLSFSLWQLCTLTMYSALVVVYTAYCALQIVQLALHYI